MNDSDKDRKADRRPQKYLWFGYGSYSAQPNLQIPAGNVRDPGLLEEFSKESNAERSHIPFFACAAIGVIGLMAFAMLLAWVVSLVIR